jgi:small subunit ribosomal protein S8
MVTDPIADMLTIIRNGYLARLKTVRMPLSKTKTAIAEVLKGESFIVDYDVKEKELVVKLRYVTVPNSLTKKPALSGIQRVSRPGLRTYADSTHLPRVMGGLGVTIISTSKGLMTSNQAKKQNLGGELICKVW